MGVDDSQPAAVDRERRPGAPAEDVDIETLAKRLEEEGTRLGAQITASPAVGRMGETAGGPVKQEIGERG
jgi:hypothetical protein